jgi:hypothetical protein
MEDLLASIRKAINEDASATQAAGGLPGAAFKGAMRELRVKAGHEISAAAAEIQELRDRIGRTRAAEPPVHDVPARPASAGIVRGAERPRTRLSEAAEPPPLRPGFAETDFAKPSTAVWRDEPAALPPPRYPAEPGILSAEASAAAASAFSRLADSVLSRAVGDRSIEDLTRDLLRAMLKQWLDENLPGLVERLVREEIERVARRGR